MATKFDAIVIGTGQAGPSLAARMTQEGMRVAIIERKLFGGTCVNTGCIPTKTLVASARAAHVARRAADFGVIIGGSITADMKQVKARKDEIVRQSNQGVTDWLKNMEGLIVFEGHGRLVGPKSVRVNGEVLEAERIVLNVGGRATIPDMPGIDEVPYLTNSSMVDVDFLPDHLVIIGGSYVGLEFAQMYRRFGSRVTIVEMAPRLIAREDADVSEAIREILEMKGLTFASGPPASACGGRIGLSQSRRTAIRDRKTSLAATSSWRWAAAPTPMIWGSKQRASKPTRAATSW